MFAIIFFDKKFYPVLLKTSPEVFSSVGQTNAVYLSDKRIQLYDFDSAVTTEIGDLTAPDLITTTHYFTGSPDGIDNDGDGIVDEVSIDEIREEYPLTGRVRKQEQRDQQDNLYTREETDWKLKIATTGVDGTQIRFPFINQIRELLYEGLETPEVIKTGFFVDDFGNVIEENRHGAESITGDEIITTRTYINDTTAWLIGLPETETVTNASGETAATSRFYYDGTEYVGLALGHAEKGNLTRRESWISDAGWLDAERYAYDTYGNRSCQTIGFFNT